MSCDDTFDAIEKMKDNNIDFPEEIQLCQKTQDTNSSVEVGAQNFGDHTEMVGIETFQDLEGAGDQEAVRCANVQKGTGVLEVVLVLDFNRENHHNCAGSLSPRAHSAARQDEKVHQTILKMDKESAGGPDGSEWEVIGEDIYKGDIIRSLQSRLDIICDEADGATDPKADGSGEVSAESSTAKPILQLAVHNLRKKVPKGWVAIMVLDIGPISAYIEVLAFAEIDMGCYKGQERDCSPVAGNIEWCSQHGDYSGRYGRDSSKSKRKMHPLIHQISLSASLVSSFPSILFSVLFLSAYTYICDYLQPSETLEVRTLHIPSKVHCVVSKPDLVELMAVKDHCVELLSMEAPNDTSALLEAETEARAVPGRPFWDLAIPFNSALEVEKPSKKNGGGTSGQESSRKSSKSSNFSIMAALLILLLSIVVGYVLFSLRAS
ncbi:ODR-4-like [Dillenia turbinata]|uniref:ODR-4-like n=1 Tax=Dillenia turbinata TaxID=194707 RepID=A0AAN8ZJM2_9MAGN